ncbi:tyrosine-type recombinase/integrase [Candidatus Methylospira mobilis]|uniref:Tyrosine-type recombinase/integrase n=1 Tax=Candidatus Methylospira mobilis TaxID=1808979 RepID=A0A5Q0BGP8_9GAMM|nr:integrase arm-type DNA-binding domain-containing protein [Candidatus Methylospira mobilis]QFY42312.1 tyrosine-type recombinase/integrase [Candidatus Methylospira mobilis]
MLTDIQIRKAKPQGKPYKLADSHQLFILVNTNGSKLWRFDYSFDGKRKTLALGSYPIASLSDARTRRDEARQLLAQGVDPAAQRKAARAAKDEQAANSFEVIAREWFEKQAPSWADTTLIHARKRLESDLLPDLGKKPITAITTRELLETLNKIVQRGATDTASRARSDLTRIFRHAILTGRAEYNPASQLVGALPTVPVKHRATIVEPKDVGDLLRAIDSYQGLPYVQAAFRLAPLVFLRPIELAQAEWSEFDLDVGEWRIPGERMKMNSRHIVPLSTQAVVILRELYLFTGNQKYLFPHARNKGQHMSRETIRAALVRIGYGPNSSTPMTAHGFRGMASTLLHEQGWPSDMIERQLAHAERNKVKAAYNHAEHLPERRRMMQAWADYLERLKNGAVVVISFRQKTAS